MTNEERIKELESAIEDMKRWFKFCGTQELMEWKPIETYKEGKVLLYYPPCRNPKNNKINKELITTDFSYTKHPTHWMPLPELPKED